MMQKLSALGGFFQENPGSTIAELEVTRMLINEPGTPSSPPTYLTESTIEANKRFFERRRCHAIIQCKVTIHHGCQRNRVNCIRI